MSQTTLDDDELFNEAAIEMRTDVDAALDAARDELPDPDEIWTVDSENTLGVLNALRSALAINDATTHLRDAKKWYTMGNRADAFDDPNDLEAAIETLEAVIEQIETAHETVTDLTSTLPELRANLSDLHSTDDT